MEKDPRYPIGKYEAQPFSEAQKKKWLADIQFLPNELEQAIENLDEAVTVDVVRDVPRDLPKGSIACLNDSFGFGGHNASIILKKFED